MKAKPINTLAVQNIKEALVLLNKAQKRIHTRKVQTELSKATGIIMACGFLLEHKIKGTEDIN